MVDQARVDGVITAVGFLHDRGIAQTGVGKWRHLVEAEKSARSISVM